MIARVIFAEIVSVNLLDTGPEPGRAGAFIVLLAFLCSFAFIRTSARLTRSVSWWPGGVETEGGVHLHHLVWGIVLLLLSGFLAFATALQTAGWQAIAVAFGIGAGFTLDEFALWVRLEDVYWAKEGRASLDAVVLAVVFAGLVVLGVKPFGLDESASIIGTAAWIAGTLLLAGAAFLKGRIVLGMIGLFFPLFTGLWAAVRLAKPTSPWAIRRYGPETLARARQRFRPDRTGARIGRRLLDALGGAPSEPDGRP